MYRLYISCCKRVTRKFFIAPCIPLKQVFGNKCKNWTGENGCVKREFAYQPLMHQDLFYLGTKLSKITVLYDTSALDSFILQHFINS